MRYYWFLIRKAGIFCPGKEIKGLRGGVHRYAAQASPQIDTARAKKHPFRTETSLGLHTVPRMVYYLPHLSRVVATIQVPDEEDNFRFRNVGRVYVDFGA